jgi:IS30 family transposase
MMGRHRSTIYRELSRHTGHRGYRPKQAQRLADERRLESRRPQNMANPEVHQSVQERLEEYWSPVGCDVTSRHTGALVVAANDL